MKLTFVRGASIKGSKKLFNSSLEGNTRRVIDLRQGEKIDEATFKELIRAAVRPTPRARSTVDQKEVSPGLTKAVVAVSDIICYRYRCECILVPDGRVIPNSR